MSDDIQKIGNFHSSHLYGNFQCPDLAHATSDVLTISCIDARECRHTLKHVQRSCIDALYNNKEPSTNTLKYFMSIWGTSYLTTMRFPKDVALVPLKPQ
jgi:hypothetical protein